MRITIDIPASQRAELLKIAGRRGKRGLSSVVREAQDRGNANRAALRVRGALVRDLAEQMVTLGRGVKVAIERRDRTEDRLDDLERRLAELEKRTTS